MKTLEIYLDNSSTTKPRQEVLAEIINQLENNYGNPSSIHRLGINSEKVIKSAREIIASSLNVKPKEIIFTSGGTESNNLALRGSISANRRAGKHIISSDIEHDSVYKTLEDIGLKDGYEITFLKPNNQGIITLEQIIDSIRTDTVLVSLMHVNNELGSINPIFEIGKYLKSLDKNIIFHVDAVQSYMKLDINCDYIDLLSISGHKIHTPKGIGALYISEKIKFSSMLTGGGQEMGYRSGTENVIYIAALEKAVLIQKNKIHDDITKVSIVRNDFLNRLQLEIKDININSSKDSLPYILNVSFLGVKGEILLHTLEQHNIFVSTGAACSSKKKGSRILESIGLNSASKDSAIRFSFSKDTTSEEVNFTVDVLKTEIVKLRKILKYK